MAFDWPGTYDSSKRPSSARSHVARAEPIVAAIFQRSQQLPVTIDPSEYVLPDAGVKHREGRRQFEHALIGGPRTDRWYRVRRRISWNSSAQH